MRSGCFGHAEEPLVHVVQGFSVEWRVGLSEPSSGVKQL